MVIMIIVLLGLGALWFKEPVCWGKERKHLPDQSTPELKCLYSKLHFTFEK